MAIERTFSIIKPNAVAKNVIGSIFHYNARQAIRSYVQQQNI